MPTDPSSFLFRRFPALTHRDFRLLWLGQMVSIAGSQMQNVAIFYQIDALTRSKTMLALVGLVRFVPIVVFALIGGVVADARNRRGIMFITQSLMMAAAIGLGVVTLVGNGSLDPWTHSWIILGLTGITAAAAAFDNPARQALIPNLVPPEHLPNAVSLNTTMFQAGMIIGPALAGVLIGQLGVEGVYWANAATFLAVIAALLLMRVVEQHTA